MRSGARSMAARRTSIFSPIFATRLRRVSSTVAPPASGSPASAAAVVADAASAARATSAAKAWNSGWRATKSVSQFTSTRSAARPSPELAVAIVPSAAMRPAFLSALASPALRMISAAASRSPPVSMSAFLHSIIPAPVRSRSVLTVSALMLMSLPALVGLARRRAAADRRLHARGLGRLVGERLLVRRFRGLGSADRRHGRRGRGFSRGTRAGRRLAAHVGWPARRAGLRLAARLAGFIEFDELVLAGRHDRNRRLAVEHGVGDPGRVELDRLHGVVIAGDHVVNAVRAAVAVDHGDHRDAELLRLVHCDLLVPDVDHEERVRERIHVLDAAEAAHQLVHLAAQRLRLLLVAALERAGIAQLLELLQALDRLPDGLEIGEHAAQPALVDEWHAGSRRLRLDGVAGAALGADEEDLAAVGDDALHEAGGLVVERQRPLQVDDVDLVAFAEDERRHLRVPEAGLVSEMDPRLEHLPHGQAGHDHSFRVSPPRTRMRQPVKGPGTQPHVSIRVWIWLRKNAALYTILVPLKQRDRRASPPC